MATIECVGTFDEIIQALIVQFLEHSYDKLADAVIIIQ